VAINRLFYQFPVGSGFTATVGARVRQDDMLAMWPSVYPGDSVLDIFTYAGAPGAYSLNLGAGAGLTYSNPNGFNASINYVSANGGNGNPGYNAGVGYGGGIMTEAAAETFTAQVGYAAKNWGAAVAYIFGQNTPFSGTPFSRSLLTRNPLTAVATSDAISTNSIGLSAYWQPETPGWIPSISAGWGYTTYGYGPGSTIVTVVAIPPVGPSQVVSPINQTAVTQSWYVGLQWADVFVKGNTLGMAVGQPTFVTADAHTGHDPNDGNYAWEWWYKVQVSDYISITPAIFYLSNPSGELANVGGVQTGNGTAAGVFNNFGALIKTTFKF